MAEDHSLPTPGDRSSGLAHDEADQDARGTADELDPPVSLRGLLRALDAMLEEQRTAQARDGASRADDEGR